MLKINEIMRPKLLAQMLLEGYVRTQKHPTVPYLIYNYTEKAAYENVWNEVTLQCRGLITHEETGEIIARPFKKFFNHGQKGAPALLYDNAKVRVTDKADGSLGILYRTPSGNLAIATRGSFTSEQALHATKLFITKYAHRWAPPPGFTFLFEIIYPDNRIVLDYNGMDDLVMLGAVDIEVGQSLPPAGFRWPGPIVQQFEYNTLEEALTAPMRPNAEGLVVHFVDTDDRIKIKQDDYVALHRILTGTTARTIWSYLAVNACKHLIKLPKHWGSRIGLDPKRAAEILAIGDNWAEKFMAGVPDEFFDWADETIARLQNEVETLRREIKVKFHEYAAQANVNGRFDRKTFWDILGVEGYERRGMIMATLDGQDITTQLWRFVYPGVELPFKKISEDVA